MTNQQPPNFLPADCGRVQDALFHQMEAELPTALKPDEQDFLDQHLIQCGDCRAYGRSMQNLQASLRELDIVETPAGLEDRIMGKIAALPENQTPASIPVRQSNRFAWKQYASLAAAVLVVAVMIPTVAHRFAPQSNVNPSSVAQLPQASSSAFQSSPSTHHNHAQLMRNRQAGKIIASTANHSTSVDSTFNETATTSEEANNETGRRETTQSDVQAKTHANANDSIANDTSHLASANVQSANQLLGENYASDKESDTYYDPVSNLVGF